MSSIWFFPEGDGVGGKSDSTSWSIFICWWSRLQQEKGADVGEKIAIWENGVALHMCRIGPNDTDCLLLFVEYRRLVPEGERGQVRDNLANVVNTWDSVAFHHSRAITNWFAANPRMVPFSSPQILSRNSFHFGGVMSLIIVCMNKCPFLTLRMLGAMTSSLNTAWGG